MAQSDLDSEGSDIQRAGQTTADQALGQGQTRMKPGVPLRPPRMSGQTSKHSGE